MRKIERIVTMHVVLEYVAILTNLLVSLLSLLLNESLCLGELLTLLLEVLLGLTHLVQSQILLQSSLFPPKMPSPISKLV